MVTKELKKLSRRELIDIIYQMKKNEQQMQKEIASLQDALQDRKIRISVAGSIAEAAVSITNLFSTAQLSADLYLQEISCMKEETERACAKKIEEANQTVAKIWSDGEKQCEALGLQLTYQAEFEKWQQQHVAVNTINPPDTQE